MKDWFKYGSGFINIDETHIYLTRSGNWTETEQLTEKIFSSTFNDRVRTAGIAVLLLAVAAFMVMLMINGIDNGDFPIMTLVGIGLFLYTLYRYFQRDIGPTFKIPFSKIQQIDIHENWFAIDFMNGYDKPDRVEFEEVEEKGIEIMRVFREEFSK